MIDDTAELVIGELRERARKLRDRRSVELIVIDYLNLVRPDRPRQNRHEEMLDICGQLKGIAKELGVPVIVTAQLNRQADARGREGQPPRLSDLRDCGSIEGDADIVGLLFRLEYYETGQEIEQVITGEAELIIAKQRNGPTGEVPLTFLKEYARFQSRIHSKPFARPPTNLEPRTCKLLIYGSPTSQRKGFRASKFIGLKRSIRDK